MVLRYTENINGKDVYRFAWCISPDVSSPRELYQQESDFGFTFKINILGRNKDLMEIYLKSANTISFDCRISFGDLGDEGINQCYETVPSNKWQYLKSFTKSEIYSKLSRRHELTINFFISINKKQVDTNDDLANDFKALYVSGLSTDVVMISEDNVEFKVHKLILICRSVVLRAHFEHNTSECRTNTINSPFEAKILKEVIHYIYTGKLEESVNTDCLLAAADFYRLDKLKDICVDLLIKELTIENALDKLKLAELYSAPKLESSILYFVKYGGAYNITTTSAWEELDSVHTLKKLYNYVLSDTYDE